MAYPPPGGGYGAPPPGYGHDLGGYGAAPPPHAGYDVRSSPYGAAAGGYGAPPPRHEGPSTDHYTAPPQPGYSHPPPGGGGAPPPGPEAYGYDPYLHRAPGGYPPPSSYPSSGYPPPEGGYPPPGGSYGGPPPGDPYYGGLPGGYGAPPPGYGPPPPGYGPPPAGGYGAPPPPGYGPPPPGYGGGGPGYDRPPPGGQGRSPPRREGGREAKRRRGDKGDGRGEKGGCKDGGGRQERGGRGGKGERGDRKGGGDGGAPHEDGKDFANSEPRGQVQRLLAKHPSWLCCWLEGVDPPKRTGSSPNVSFLILANPALKKEGGGEEFGFMVSQVRLAAKKRERERECTKELAALLGAVPVDDPKAWCTLPSAASTRKEVDPFDVEKVRGMVSGRVPKTTVELQDTTACLMTGSSPFMLDKDRPKGVGLVQEPDIGVLDRLDPGFGDLWAEARRVSGIVRKQWFVSVLTVKAQGSDRALALGVGIATERATAQVRALHSAESRVQILTPEMLAKAV